MKKSNINREHIPSQFVLHLRLALQTRNSPFENAAVTIFTRFNIYILNDFIAKSNRLNLY